MSTQGRCCVKTEAETEVIELQIKDPQGLGHPAEAGGCKEDRSLERLEEHSPAGSLISDLKPSEMWDSTFQKCSGTQLQALLWQPWELHTVSKIGCE